MQPRRRSTGPRKFVRASSSSAFLRPDRAAASVSLILDIRRRIGTIVLGQLPTRRETEEPLLSRIERGAELTAVQAEIQSLSIDVAMSRRYAAA